jgi:hypothetical protein
LNRTQRLIGAMAGAGALALGIAWIVPRVTAGPEIPVLHASDRSFTLKEQPEAGLCPWRAPAADRKRFFPNATGYRDETLILSGLRLEVAHSLGRMATGEENALKIHRILQGQTPIGVVITRRVKGESGVIEIVLAVDSQGKVLGAKLQRLREPDTIATALQSEAWLGAFAGKSARSDWRSGGDLPSVPREAQPSAAAILEGTRTALILLDVAGHHAVAQPHHF